MGTKSKIRSFWAGLLLLGIPALAANTHTIMKITPEWYKTHITKKKKMPKFEVPKGYRAKSVSANLLNELDFSGCNGARGWDQGQSGNCWVFGSTAAASIMGCQSLSVPQLFSVQWFDSAYYAQGNGLASTGGDTAMFAEWYAKNPKFLPWTNPGANYVDQGGGYPKIEAGKIAQTPNVPFNTISVSEVVTRNVSSAQAIANIKGALDMGKPVIFSYFLPGAGWNDFNRFWDSAPETMAWGGVDNYNGSVFDAQGGGHLVCIVGYDDSANTWIALNSWGVANARPNGCFALPQEMGYNNQMSYSNMPLAQYEFDVLDINWGHPVPTNQIEAQIIDPSSNMTVSPGVTVNFQGGAKGNDLSGLTYTWNFGDGQAAAGERVSHVFQNPGQSTVSYNVILTVSNAAGLSDTELRVINVIASPLPPPTNTITATISQPAYDMTVEDGTTLSFVGTGTTTGTNRLRYEWSLPNGSTTKGENANFTFSNPGNYPALVTVTLRVYDRTGASATATRNITVNPKQQQAELQITPGYVRLYPGQAFRFRAIGAHRVRWSCDGGTIDERGNYVAPSQFGSYTITARSHGRVATARVYVREAHPHVPPGGPHKPQPPFPNPNPGPHHPGHDPKKPHHN